MFMNPGPKPPLRKTPVDDEMVQTFKRAFHLAFLDADIQGGDTSFDYSIRAGLRAVHMMPEELPTSKEPPTPTKPKAYIKAGGEWHPIGSIGPLDREKMSGSPMGAIIFGLIVGIACSAIAFFLIAMVLWA